MISLQTSIWPYHSLGLSSSQYNFYKFCLVLSWCPYQLLNIVSWAKPKWSMLCIVVPLTVCVCVSFSLGCSQPALQCFDVCRMCLCVCVSVCLCFSVSVFLCFCVSVFLFFCFSVFLCFCVYVFMCFSVSVCLCVSVSVCMCDCVSVCLCFLLPALPCFGRWLEEVAGGATMPCCHQCFHQVRKQEAAPPVRSCPTYYYY